jgi:acyl-CoA reductase-like NAD-dependent aldehyde dehydrogenase
VPPSARLAREEIFGPVLSVIPFDEESNAIRIANDTIYGLTAFVWTSNLSRAMRMANGIRSSLRINSAVPLGEGAGVAHSNEPARQTGIGVEGGLPGMENYTRRQLIAMNY